MSEMHLEEMGRRGEGTQLGGMKDAAAEAGIYRDRGETKQTKVFRF